ncbi:substrate-binding domain-containing protein [Micromonospora sp. NPDC049102]|uniref:substrate-binding domain-containing protein n=1 Tax=Micromonospora sp. NPDC049102 TaxID=3364265 RepID=UPI0037225143
MPPPRRSDRSRSPWPVTHSCSAFRWIADTPVNCSAATTRSTRRFRSPRHRWECFRDAWTGAGRPAAQLRLAVCPVNHSAEGETFALELLQGAEPPDAIAAMSDELALGALRAATRVGLRVPDDLTLTGWDDADAAADAGLTTLAQSLREQGAHCARVALGHSTDAPPRHLWQVVTRSTTRRPH